MSNTKLWVPTEPPNIDIHFDEVPAVDMRLLCLSIARAAERYFEDPQHLAEFEAWRKSQHKEAAAT